MTLEDFINFFTKNTGTIIEYTENHFTLVLSAVAISLVIWVPIGLLLTKNDKWAARVLALANTIFCIPSLSMFAILVAIPTFGLGRKSALFALVLYAMMPLIRNVYDGVKNVDRNVIEAARGMGMSSGRIMREILLPLGIPIIFAGFRITVVMTTGIAAIATYIGERNLGRFISEGLVRSNTPMMVTGALIISLIAIGLDTILGVIEKRIVPRGLRINR
ncbi:ABC transporter permease [Desulfosporosinus sp. BG]|uniref:ABC transporter permease n=1 Tax=Desulfosporosinus sp. BG TaxID=1633135 RepID=UPI00083B0064|nr:ABC transporter permease [Desulfosporosinus sp. BG]ODA42880.1 putative glycine betaine/carnitine/choline ABC transporter (permease and substrate binding protein) [Desulfosporosinus sp. BG]